MSVPFGELLKYLVESLGEVIGLSQLYCGTLIKQFVHSFLGFLFHLLFWRGEVVDTGVLVSASLPCSGLVVAQTE